MPGRILAFIVAVAMVAGAIWYRGQGDDDDVDAPTDVAADAPLRLVCATELESACQAIVEAVDETIELRIEPAGVTADRLSAVRGAAGLEVWMTPGPWPAIVRQARERAQLAPLLQAPNAAVARSRVALVMWRERARALATRCRGGQVELKCLGQAATDGPWSKSGGSATWGDVKPGLADPIADAGGLVGLAAGTVSFFESADLSSVDLRERDDYRAWLTGLARSVRPADVGRMLATRAAELDAVIGFEAVVVPIVRSAARPNEVEVIYPLPVVAADVVLGTVPGKRADRLVEILRGNSAREELARAGWQRPTGATGLPDPGLLAALRSTWSEVRR